VLKEMPGNASFHLLALLLALFLPVSTRAQGEKKTAFGLLVDNTRSLENQFPQVLSLSEGIIKRIQPLGPVAIFDFIAKRDGDNRSPVVISSIGWSRDEKELADYLGTITVVAGRSKFLDDIYSVAVEVKAKADSDKETFGDKMLILITDGDYYIKSERKGMVITTQDQADERIRKENELVKRLKETGVKVYAIGLVRELSAEGAIIIKSDRENAETLLTKITKGTGGRVVFIRSKKIDIDAVLNKLFAK
jgi:hypothetical protein